MDEVQSYYGSWHDPRDPAAVRFQSRASDLISQSDQWLNKYNGNQEATSYINSVVSALDEVGTYTTQMQDFYSSFTPTQEQAEQGLTAESLYNSWYADHTYRQKYSGKSYSELNEIISTMPEGEEKTWLTSYAPTVMTASDYDDEINATRAELSRLELMLKKIHNSGIQANALEAWYTDLITSAPEARIDPVTDANNLALYNELRGDFNSFGDIEIAIATAKDKLWNLENQKKYNLLSQNEDYDTHSKATATEITSNWFDQHLNSSRFHYDVVNGLLDPCTGYKEEGNFIAATIMGLKTENLSYLTVNERNNYNYLHNTQGVESAEEYLNYLENTLSERAKNYTQEQWSALAEAHPVGSNIMSVPLALWGGIGYIDVLGQKLSGTYKKAQPANTPDPSTTTVLPCYLPPHPLPFGEQQHKTLQMSTV